MGFRWNFKFLLLLLSTYNMWQWKAFHTRRNREESFIFLNYQFYKNDKILNLRIVNKYTGVKWYKKDVCVTLLQSEIIARQTTITVVSVFNKGRERCCIIWWPTIQHLSLLYSTKQERVHRLSALAQYILFQHKITLSWLWGRVFAHETRQPDHRRLLFLPYW